MPRSRTTDFVQGYRFQVKIDRMSGGEPTSLGLEGRGDTAGAGKWAGFKSCSIPGMSADAVEYREGIWRYKRKQAGPLTIGDAITLMRGVSRGDNVFVNWMMRAHNGEEYRADFSIYILPPTQNLEGAAYENAPWDKALRFKCYEGFPTRVKGMADLDADAGDVAVAELELQIEHFEIENRPLEA